MLAPKIFEHEQFGQCRFVTINGEPWFVAADLCRALEIKQPARALSRLDDDEKGVTTIHTLGGPQQVLIVSEPGLYRLIFTSRKAEARQFQRWVCHEVLPSIRKYGYYVAPHQRIIEIKGEENLKSFKALERGDNVPVPLEQRFVRIVNYRASSLNTSGNLEKLFGGLSAREMSCQAQSPTFSKPVLPS